jgi:PAS domain S-box-containing protein
MLLEQYQKAIENNNIVSKTDIEGIITFVNDEFCKIYGYSREELIGVNHNIIRHPDVPTKKFEILWNTILEKKTYKSTIKNLAKDGSTFYVNTTIIPILDENDKILEYIAIRYDVTEQTQLKHTLEAKEKELEEVNKKLEKKIALKIKEKEKLSVLFHQSRLASMGQMIANIAHQWRQPLTSLTLSLFNMKKEAHRKDLKSLDAIYKNSKNSIKNMSETLENFTDFFKPNKNKSEFLIKDCIEEALLLLDGTIKDEKIYIEVINIDDMKLIGIQNELTQIFINLIQNSKDAFSLNKITNKKIIITVKKNKKKTACISFEDNAGGISQDIINNIFEPYFTTKHKYQGTGLGLFMSNMICEQSFNGYMDVTSKNNKSIFKIELPIKG